MLLQVFWSCIKLGSLWKDIRTIIQKCTDYKVPEDLPFFLLHASTIPAKVYKKSKTFPPPQWGQGLYSPYLEANTASLHWTVAEEGGGVELN